MRLMAFISTLPIGPPRRYGISEGDSGRFGLSDGFGGFDRLRDRGRPGWFWLSFGIGRYRSGGDMEDGGFGKNLFGEAAQVGAGDKRLAAPAYPGQQML